MTLVAMLCGVAAMAQNEVYCTADAIKPGEQGLLAVCVANADPFVRIQIQFKEVPTGISLGRIPAKFVLNEERLDMQAASVAAGFIEIGESTEGIEPSDVFDMQRLSNGIMMLASKNAGYYDGGNFVNVAFLGNDGALFSIPVTVAETVAEGPCTLTFDAKIFGSVSDPYADVPTLAAQEGAEFTLTVGEGTGINTINAADSKAPIYNVAGQRVSKAQKGVFIQNGKKVAVK